MGELLAADVIDTVIRGVMRLAFMLTSLGCLLGRCFLSVVSDLRGNHAISGCCYGVVLARLPIFHHLPDHCSPNNGCGKGSGTSLELGSGQGWEQFLPQVLNFEWPKKLC